MVFLWSITLTVSGSYFFGWMDLRYYVVLCSCIRGHWFLGGKSLNENHFIDICCSIKLVSLDGSRQTARRMESYMIRYSWRYKIRYLNSFWFYLKRGTVSCSVFDRFFPCTSFIFLVPASILLVSVDIF